MEKRKISELKPHPKNIEIYGYNEDISDLVEKISRSHRVHTMVINSDGYILAGHRRHRVCLQLGIKEVDVEIRDFNSPEEEIEFIIDDNATRDKTVEQKSREAKELKRIETLLAEKRMSIFGATGGRGNKKGVANSPHGLEQIEQVEQGKTRDIVARKVGLKSGREAERAITTVEIIDKLNEDGRTEDADLVKSVLNNGSVSAAEELARNIDKVEIPEEVIDLVKAGKRSPHSYIEVAKAKMKQKAPTDDDFIQPETKKCNCCGKELPLYEFTGESNTCRECRAAKDRERRSGIFKDSMGNLIEYDKSIVGSDVMLEVIADLKNDKDTKQGTNYGIEFELFLSNLNDYLFANQKFIDGAIFLNMPSDIKNKFKEEMTRLSEFTQVLKKNLK